MGGKSQSVWWLAKYKGFYQYGLSPFYQKAFLGDIGHEMKVLCRFVKEKTLLFVPFIALGYGVVYWGNAYHTKLHRKNPNDYLPGAPKPASH